MKKRFMFRVGAACMTAVFFVFAGCQDKDYYDSAPDSVNGDETSLLNYSTGQSVKLDATYNVEDSVIVVYDVYTENPLVMNSDGRYELKSGLTPIAGGIADNGKIDLTKTVPATTKELYLYTQNCFVPQLMHAKIEAGMANFDIVDVSIDATESTSAATRTLANGRIDGYLTKTGVGSEMDINRTTYKPNYIVGTKTIAPKYTNRIAQAFPEKKAVTNDDYYKDAVLYLYESAEVKLAMVSEQADYKNTLSYFFYEGKPEDIGSIDRAKIKEVVALPYAKLDKTNGLKAGEMVQLMYYDAATQKYVKQFPKGVTIGFILRSNAFDAFFNPPFINMGRPAFYSMLSLNNDKFPHTIIFDAATKEESEKGQSFYCFGFEDTLNGGDKDCNDLMFHVDVNPAKAIVKPEPLPEVGHVHYTEKYKGVLSFEDGWPYKRDYDLNDVVVNLSSKTTFLQKTEKCVPVTDILLQTIEDKVTLVHSGGDFTCGFAYKVNINPSFLANVTIDGVAYTPIADGNGFIIKICDNVAHEVQSQNPRRHEYISIPKTFNVKMNFKEGAGITQKMFCNDKLGAPYNPYITPINEFGSVEVHLPFYPPTDEANLDHLFGKANDRSIPQKGIWYVGCVNDPYPFAVHLFNVDEYKKLPIEGQKISYTYPKFTDWVKSNFTSSLDWFEHPAN